MNQQTIAGLVKSAPVLTVDDPVRRAAGLIRASGGSAVLVAKDGRIFGAVSERSIAGRLSAADDVERALDERIEPLVEPSGNAIGPSVSLRQAAGMFASVDVDFLPVVREDGFFQGVLYRHDVVGALAQTLRPASVGGMATPLGVYLTTGSHNGGAGNLGLFLAGASIMLMILAASLIVTGLEHAVAAITKVPVPLYMKSTPLTTRLNIYDLAFYISTALNVVIMLLLLRLSPLSGYHAAEHMTVHAIEAGEALTPDAVRHMPRVHPRCGTNLLAAAGVFLIITTRVSGQLAVLVALLIVIFGWRALGAWLQYFVTTKDPTDKQLESGIAAGRDILARFQEQPNRQVQGFDRVWNMGFLQTATGMAFIGLVGYVLYTYAHVEWLRHFVY